MLQFFCQNPLFSGQKIGLTPADDFETLRVRLGNRVVQMIGREQIKCCEHLVSALTFFLMTRGGARFEMADRDHSPAKNSRQEKSNTPNWLAMTPEKPFLAALAQVIL